MMKTFQFKDKQIRTRSRRKSRIKLWIIAIFIVFTVISLIWPNMLTSLTHGISRPIWKLKVEVIDRSILASFVGYFQTKGHLNKENESLKESLSKAEYRLFEMDFVKGENLKLRNALGMQEYGEVSVFSYVLSRPNITIYDSLILDSGIGRGVRVGDLVKAEEFIVIGEIVGVTEKTSQARLFSTSGVRSEVVIGSSLGAVAIGIGGGNFQIELPRNISVKEGMSVKLSSFPRTLLGFVEAIEKESSDSFQKIYIRSPINVSNLDSVLVVRVGE